MIFIYFKKILIMQLTVATLCFCEEIEKAEDTNNFPEFENQEVFTSTDISDAESILENGTNRPEQNNNRTKDILQETANKTHKFVQCLSGMGSPFVQLTNDTELIKLLQPDLKAADRDSPGLCVIILFYSKFCPFSSMAAPHYNALARAFPDIKMVAINAIMYHLFNTQNGIVGVPSLMLFHSGRPVAKFNDSEYTLEQFSKFITKYTGIKATEKSTVTSSDFAGPVVSNPSKEFDMLLIISWMFIIVCSGYFFTKSKWWSWIIESIQSNWRESEAHAQHEHLD